MIRSTFGASAGGTTRGGHHGVDWSASFSIVPPKGMGAGGSWLPSSVIVPLGEPIAFCAVAFEADSPTTSPQQRNTNVEMACMT
jgi:hypothetical protein